MWRRIVLEIQSSLFWGRIKLRVHLRVNRATNLKCEGIGAQIAICDLFVYLTAVVRVLCDCDNPIDSNITIASPPRLDTTERRGS